MFHPSRGGEEIGEKITDGVVTLTSNQSTLVYTATKRCRLILRSSDSCRYGINRPIGLNDTDFNSSGNINVSHDDVFKHNVNYIGNSTSSICIMAVDLNTNEQIYGYTTFSSVNVYYYVYELN